MAIRNATDFCKTCEARLGWVPPAGPPFRRYQGMASRVTKRLAELDSSIYTWRNIELAVELCVREKLPRNPLGVLKLVPRALEMSRLPETDLDEQIRSAVRYEAQRGDPNGWVTRFARAQGVFRQEALEEWRAGAR